MDQLQALNQNLDAQDLGILRDRAGAFQALQGPRVGDWVQMPDGTLRRFAHDCGNGIQTTMPGIGRQSFHLTFNGHASYSGALDPAIMKDRLKLISDNKPGLFWFFHHDRAVAHNGVDVSIPCRLYRYD